MCETYLCSPPPPCYLGNDALGSEIAWGLLQICSRFLHTEKAVPGERLDFSRMSSVVSRKEEKWQIDSSGNISRILLMEAVLPRLEKKVIAWPICLQTAVKEEVCRCAGPCWHRKDPLAIDTGSHTYHEGVSPLTALFSSTGSSTLFVVFHFLGPTFPGDGEAINKNRT